MRVNVTDISTQRLCIGYEGEQNHIQVVFDCSVVFGEYPEAYAQMAIRPPQGDIYPKVLTRDGNTAIWNIGAADCAVPGNGEYQITFVNGETIVKSYIGFFSVRESLVANGEAPEPVEDWMEQVEAALDAFDNLTASAETLPAGSSATAEVTMVNGHKNVVFGIPEGEKGEQGDPGEDGAPGADGFSPVVTVTDITGGHRVSITDATGTKTFDVMNGEDGAPGQDGVSPTVTVTDITGGHTVTITDATGSTSFNVMDGQQGEPGDPTKLIDDESTTATNKVWSAKKSNDEVSDLLQAISQKYEKPSGGIPATDLASGVIPSVPVQDVQVNGTSILSQGVANVPIASTSSPGAVIVGSGLRVTTANKLFVNTSGTETIKAGTEAYNPVVPSHQHESTFYGLAKAAGDSTQSASSNAVGTYTESAKSAISQMLDAPEMVSGTTPSITAKAGVSYICGECSTLTITLPASGCFDVVFESGSTPTVLTATGVTWPDWFDATSLEANRTYEININNGKGAVMSWA